MVREQYVSVAKGATCPSRRAEAGANMEEIGSSMGGGSFEADVETTCICMPIKFWFFVMAVIHVGLLIFSISSRFYFVFDTVLVVFALLIVFLPQYFSNFFHFVLQAVFWAVSAIVYLVWFLRELFDDQHMRLFLLFFFLIVYAVTFTILFARLAMASQP